MSDPKISVVIPYDGNDEGLNKSLDNIFSQKYSEDKLEVIIVNMTGEDSAELTVIEQAHSESVMVINTGEKTEFFEARNLGLDYFSGDYVLFLDCGDIFNANLFGTISGLISDEQPDLICFKTTVAMPEFTFFGYESFSVDDVKKYRFSDIAEKKKILNNPELNENYHSYVLGRNILLSSGQRFSGNEYDEESTFVFPLLILSDSLVLIPEQGYCHFYRESEESRETRALRINSNLKAQLNLYGLFKSLPDLFEDYYDLVDAHFLRRYFIHTIDLFRGGYEACLSVQQFQLMQLTCMKLMPFWIHNDYVYAFSRREMEWLKSLLKRFDNEDQLLSEFCGDAKISVIMTTYNRAHILNRGIQNILKQTWQNFEFIIVNDNSSDDTEKVVKEYDDSRIVYVKNNDSKGVSYARNLGLCKATCEYIIYQDDDDLARLDKLEKMIYRMGRASKDTAAVYHETIMYKESEDEGTVEVNIIPDREIDDIRKSGYIFPALLPTNFIALPSIMVRKSCLDKVGGFDERLIAYEDWELCLRLAKEYDLDFIKEPMYDYFRGSTGLISNKDEAHRKKVLDSMDIVGRKYEQDRRDFNIGSDFTIAD